MLQRIAFAINKWFALRSFPQGVPGSSYVFLDYFVLYSGSHDRVMLYENNNAFFLHYSCANPLSDKDTNLKTMVTLEEATLFFSWLRDHFPNSQNTLLTATRRDPAKLTLYAVDTRNDWKCSLCVSDVHLYEELINIRGEIVERVKRMAPDARV